MDVWTPVWFDYQKFEDKLDQIMPILQRMEDDPVFLETERHRYDNAKIPSTSDMTRSTTKGTISPEKPYDEPLSTQEIYLIKESAAMWGPLYRYNRERRQEWNRISRESSKIDKNHNVRYRGPDLTGRTGEMRFTIMARHSIKKRWERLGMWNSEWNTLSHPKSDDKAYSWIWNFDSKSPRGERKYDQLPFSKQKTSWPARSEENRYERAIRVHLEQKGSWNKDFYFVSSGSEKPSNIHVDDRGAFLTGRPWYVWNIDVQEERIRIERKYKELTRMLLSLSEENVRARWKEKGIWKESWADYPGWKWRHESPSPEPPDPNDMDFTPSEVDALERMQAIQLEPVAPIQHELEWQFNFEKPFAPHGDSGDEEEAVMDALSVNEDVMPCRTGSGGEDTTTVAPASNTSLTPSRAGARRTPPSDYSVGSGVCKARKTKGASRPLTQPSGVFKPVLVLRRSARIAERSEKSDAARAAAEVVESPKGGRAAPPRAPRRRREQEHHQQKQRTATRASARRKGASEKETAKTQEVPAEATTRRRDSLLARLASKP